MTATIIPSGILFTQDSVRLGRFITSIEQPHQGYHDPPSATQPHPLVSSYESYAGEHQNSTNSNFGSTLTSFVSAGFSKRARMKFKLASELVKTYRLDNSDGWFDEATTLPDTRRWVERQFDRGKDVYVVVGYHTITNASIIRDSLIANKTEGQMQVPVSLSPAAAGAVVPLGNVMDASVRVQNQGSEGAQAQFIAPGEQVCALEYRQVRYRWLSSKNLDQARLSEVRQWLSMERSRDDEDGEDDILEVDLVDVKDLEGWWDSQAVDDNIFLVPTDE